MEHILTQVIFLPSVFWDKLVIYQNLNWNPSAPAAAEFRNIQRKTLGGLSVGSSRVWIWADQENFSYEKRDVFMFYIPQPHWGQQKELPQVETVLCCLRINKCTFNVIQFSACIFRVYTEAATFYLFLSKPSGFGTIS